MFDVEFCAIELECARASAITELCIMLVLSSSHKKKLGKKAVKILFFT